MIQRLLSLSDPVVIAHRGGSKVRPENTMMAFDHAATLGVDGLECDVHLSRDDEPVVIHDATLDRTTDAAGPVAGRTADELARVDAGARFGEHDGAPYRGRGEGVPRLEHVLRRHDNLPMVIEIKGDDPRAAERTLDVVRACRAEERVIIGGFSHAVLSAVRRQAPEIPTSASRLEVQAAVRRSLFRLRPRATGFRLVQAPFRFRGRQVFGGPFVRAVRRGAWPLHAWIVDDPADMKQLLAWGVTGLISDRPDLAMEIVGETRRRNGDRPDSNS